MKRRCSDKRLMQLIRKALYALEDPAAGFVFDDFDLRYRERERKRLELPPKRRAILDALAIDWRSRPAAQIAGVDHKTVDQAKKIFKTHFAQCFQAWKRDFAF